MSSVGGEWFEVFPHMNTESSNAQRIRFKTARSKNRGSNVSFYSIWVLGQVWYDGFSIP